MKKNINQKKKNISNSHKIFAFSLFLLLVMPVFFVGAQANTPIQNRSTSSIETAPNIKTVQVQGFSLSCTFAKLGGNTVTDFFDFGTCLVGKAVLPLLFMFAFVSFIWGVVQFMLNSDEEAKREQGRQFMIWGIIAIAVIGSIWGLVGILTKTFNLGSVAPQQDVSP